MPGAEAMEDSHLSAADQRLVVEGLQGEQRPVGIALAAPAPGVESGKARCLHNHRHCVSIRAMDRPARGAIGR